MNERIQMKTKKSDLLELQSLYLDHKRARAPRKAKLQVAMEKIKNRMPEHLVQRVEDYLQRDRLALVPGDNGICGGCHIRLPNGVSNTIALSDELFLCENCGCLVYAQDDERDSAKSALPLTGTIR